MLHTKETLAVRRYLEGVDLRLASIVDAAAECGCSERTLRRKLEDAHTSYVKLLHDERGRRAYAAVIEDPNISIDALCDLLNYQDTQNLYRQCEKWFGVKLKDFRRLAKLRDKSL